MEYLCDNRADCRDMSDETNCGEWLQLGGQVVTVGFSMEDWLDVAGELW